MNTQLSTEAVTDMVKLISRATEAVRVRVYQPWMTFPIFYWLFGHKKTEDDLQKTGNVLMDKVQLRYASEISSIISFGSNFVFVYYSCEFKEKRRRKC
jgi:hypothetical protein